MVISCCLLITNEKWSVFANLTNSCFWMESLFVIASIKTILIESFILIRANDQLSLWFPIHWSLIRVSIAECNDAADIRHCSLNIFTHNWLIISTEKLTVVKLKSNTLHKIRFVSNRRNSSLNVWPNSIFVIVSVVSCLMIFQFNLIRWFVLKFNYSCDFVSTFLLFIIHQKCIALYAARRFV